MGGKSGLGSLPTSRVTFTSSSTSVGKRISDLNSPSRVFPHQSELKRFGVSFPDQTTMDQKSDSQPNHDSPYSRDVSGDDSRVFLNDSELVFGFQPESVNSKQASSEFLGRSFLQGQNDASVPVFVMLPLDTIDRNGVFKYAESVWFYDALKVLVSTGVKGVAVDVWWGVVERQPRVYFWNSYRTLFRTIQSLGLTLQVVLSFHACGGNVGDVVQIPLPLWVLESGDSDPDIFLSDRPRQYHGGRRNREYLSLFADEVPSLVCGRSPMECYADFMESFRDEFEAELGSLIVDLVIGAGPCGELRFPSYAAANGWRFPGIGEFQCYDRHALSSLAQCATEIGHKEWGNGGPHDAGVYNNWPENAPFFDDKEGAWSTRYGQFFLQWYSNSLLQHGRRLMQLAYSIFTSKTEKFKKPENPAESEKIQNSENLAKFENSENPAKTGKLQNPENLVKLQNSENAVRLEKIQNFENSVKIVNSENSVLSGLKMWLSKTGTELCRSPSTASGTDLCLSDLSTTGSLRSASMSSLLRDSSEESIVKNPQTNGPNTSSSMEADYDFLDVGRGVFAPVRVQGQDSGRLKDSSDELIIQGSEVLTKDWNAGDFLRRIVSFLHHRKSEDQRASVQLSLKIAGVHWWYRTRSHAAELTAGYFNSDDHCGYEKIVDLCREFGFNLILTCIEMSDGQHPHEVRSSPQNLLHQIRSLAAIKGVKLSGENALPVFHPHPANVDLPAFDRIIEHCSRTPNKVRNSKVERSLQNSGMLEFPKLHSFTFLRLVPELLMPLYQGLWMRFMHGMEEPMSYLRLDSSIGGDTSPISR